MLEETLTLLKPLFGAAVLLVLLGLIQQFLRSAQERLLSELEAEGLLRSARRVKSIVAGRGGRPRQRYLDLYLSTSRLVGFDRFGACRLKLDLDPAEPGETPLTFGIDAPKGHHRWLSIDVPGLDHSVQLRVDDPEDWLSAIRDRKGQADPPRYP